MDLTALTFTDASFDAVTCKDGLMFCADPVKARVSCDACSSRADASRCRRGTSRRRTPSSRRSARWCRSFMPRPTPRAGAPGPFRLAPAAEFESVLRQAGFGELDDSVGRGRLRGRVDGRALADRQRHVGAGRAGEGDAVSRGRPAPEARDGGSARAVSRRSSDPSAEYGIVHFGPALICCARMRITVAHHIPASCQRWRDALARELPDAEVDIWGQGRAGSADYAIAWAAPGKEFFAQHDRLKAFFCTGAGVEKLLASSDMPKSIPVIRLEDAGMGAQMADYCVYAVLHWLRRRSEYDEQQRAHVWKQLPTNDLADWPDRSIRVRCARTASRRCVRRTRLQREWLRALGARASRHPIVRGAGRGGRLRSIHACFACAGHHRAADAGDSGSIQP